jgi:hypothetical protein
MQQRLVVPNFKGIQPKKVIELWDGMWVAQTDGDEDVTRMEQADRCNGPIRQRKGSQTRRLRCHDSVYAI